MFRRDTGDGRYLLCICWVSDAAGRASHRIDSSILHGVLFALRSRTNSSSIADYTLALESEWGNDMLINNGVIPHNTATQTAFVRTIGSTRGSREVQLAGHHMFMVSSAASVIGRTELVCAARTRVLRTALVTAK